MRARIFSGDSWVGGVFVSGAGAEGEEVEGGKVDLRRASEERSSSLRRATVVRDMVPWKKGFPNTGSGILLTRLREDAISRAASEMVNDILSLLRSDVYC